MRYSNIFFTLLLLAVLALAGPAAADTRYVVDELIITLRQGKGTDYKIIKSLKTGTPLEVLEDVDKTYLKVRTADGTVGYVLRQYVSRDLPKPQRIAELETINATLLNRTESLEEAKSGLDMQLKALQESYGEELSATNTKIAQLEKDLDQALENERISAERYNTLLEQAQNVVEIAAERDLLAQENKKLAEEAGTLRQKNERLADSRMIRWFLAGGGVFFFGWLIGKISRKKRSSF